MHSLVLSQQLPDPLKHRILARICPTQNSSSAPPSAPAQAPRTVRMILAGNLQQRWERLLVLVHRRPDLVCDLRRRLSCVRELGQGERTCWLMSTIATSGRSVNSAKADSIVDTGVSGTTRDQPLSQLLPADFLPSSSDTATYWSLQRRSSSSLGRRCVLFLLGACP